MFKTKNKKLAVRRLLVIFDLNTINALFYSIGYAFSLKTSAYIISSDYMADLFKVGAA